MTTENNTSSPETGTKEWIELETRHLSLAGQITAIRATGVNFKRAGLDASGQPVLQLHENALFAGFNDHVLAQDDPLPAIERHVRSAGPPMSRRMLVAQVRAISAGEAAVNYGDITGVFGFSESDQQAETRLRSGNLFRAFARLLEEDSDPLDKYPDEVWGVLLDVIREDAEELITSNWFDVCRTYWHLKDDRELLPTCQALLTVPGLCPVDMDHADALFETAEEWGGELAALSRR